MNRSFMTVNTFHGRKASAEAWCTDEGTPVLELHLCPTHVVVTPAFLNGNGPVVGHLEFAKQLQAAVSTYVFELERAVFVTDHPEAI